MDQTTLQSAAQEVSRLTLYMPNWAVSVLILAVALAVGLLLHRVVFSLLRRLVALARAPFWTRLVSRLQRPVRLALAILALALGAAVAPMGPATRAWFGHGLLVASLVLLFWVIHSAMNFWVEVYLRRFSMESEDNLLARKHVTQTKILLRVLNTTLIVLAIGSVLMTFGPVRQYGVSLLASAGAAGLVVGLALQPVLKNLFAGIQLAITQPIRLDDALIVEGEWGQVEEITSTYVVVRIWDWRRLVVPLSYFIEKPFQNWTRDSSSLIGSIYLYLDPAADVVRIREHGQAVVEKSKLWDDNVYSCAVTDIRDWVIEVRILASARNAGRTFDLRCELREKMLAFLRDEMPEALPRGRAEVSLDPSARRLTDADLAAGGLRHGGRPRG